MDIRYTKTYQIHGNPHGWHHRYLAESRGVHHEVTAFTGENQLLEASQVADLLYALIGEIERPRLDRHGVLRFSDGKPALNASMHT